MTLYNADDYGITMAQAEHILDCRRAGKLTGVSLMPNSPCLEQAAALLREDRDLLVAVHLNLTEGLCLSPPGEVPLLAAADGRFRLGFFGLFLRSLVRPRAMHEQMVREFTAQLRRCLPLLEGRPLRLDGHQHVHMIPAVMAAVRDTLAAEGLQAAYIRYSQEPLWPCLRHRELWRTYRPVNLLKNLVLNIFALWDGRTMRAMGLRKNRIMGLALSGDMALDPVRALLPDMERAAAKRGADLELVMHPGWGIGPGEGLDVPGGPFEAFALSPGRRREYDCLRRLP